MVSLATPTLVDCYNNIAQDQKWYEIDDKYYCEFCYIHLREFWKSSKKEGKLLDEIDMVKCSQKCDSAKISLLFDIVGRTRRGFLESYTSSVGVLVDGKKRIRHFFQGKNKDFEMPELCEYSLLIDISSVSSFFKCIATIVVDDSDPKKVDITGGNLIKTENMKFDSSKGKSLVSNGILYKGLHKDHVVRITIAFYTKTLFCDPAIRSEHKYVVGLYNVSHVNVSHVNVSHV